MRHWDRTLETGVVAIDDGHRELFRRTGWLIAAMGERRGTAELVDLMGWLDDHVVAHFAEEAKLMAALGFPSARTHAASHGHFAREYRALALRLAVEGPTPLLAVKLSRLLSDWLREHVRELDRELACYARERRSRAA